MWRLTLIIILVFVLMSCSVPPDQDDVAPPPAPQPTPVTGPDPTPMPPPAPSPSPVIMPAPPPPQPDEVSALLAGLQTYPIAYETPQMATVGTVFDVTLAIDATGDDSAVEGLPQSQNVTENVAHLAESVEAKLSGAAFEIKSANATTQRLHPGRETVWRWSVEPLQAGDHSLYLEIFAKVGENETLMLESFNDLIPVDVAIKKDDKPRLIDDVRVYVSVIGGIVSLILGLIALSGHLKRRAASEEE